MKTNQAGIKILHDFERCVLKAYLCPKALENKKKGLDVFYTIGWGCTFYEDGSKIKEGDVITQERADSLFKFILTRFEEQAERAITSSINENQFSAFVSALYNIGPGSKIKDGLIRLRNGQPSTLLKKINKDPNDPSIGPELERWISKGSSFEAGLKRRRQAESKLYFTKP